MSTPVGSGRSISSQVHLTAADALASLIAQGEAWPPASLQRFRNVLLDACGSDHRPLIELLLRVGRHGIVDALRALGPVAPSAWPTKRTTLVSRACGELFIGAEIAAWAVDAWAVALGVVPRSAAQALQVEYAANATRARQRAEAVPAAKTRAMRGAAAGAGAGASNAGTLHSGAAVSPGGAANSRVGAWKRGAAVAIMASPRWRVPAASIPAPNLTSYYRVLAVATVAMLSAVVWQRLSAREAASSIQAARAPASATASAASGANAPSDVPSGASASNKGASTRGTDSDSVMMPSEQLRVQSTGINPDARLTPPGDSGSRRSNAGAEAAPDVMREVRGAAAADMRALGVGGTYTVQQRILSVGGNALCDPLADALSQRVMQSEEQFTHTPDSTHFALASRPGVRGVVQRDGVFYTAPYIGTHDGVRIQFQMSGRFTPTGFLARTITETDAVLKYRQQQRCVVVADLIGSRSASVNTPE